MAHNTEKTNALTYTVVHHWWDEIAGEMIQRRDRFEGKGAQRRALQFAEDVIRKGAEYSRVYRGEIENDRHEIAGWKYRRPQAMEDDEPCYDEYDVEVHVAWPKLDQDGNDIPRTVEWIVMQEQESFLTWKEAIEFAESQWREVVGCISVEVYYRRWYSWRRRRLVLRGTDLRKRK